MDGFVEIAQAFQTTQAEHQMTKFISHFSKLARGEVAMPDSSLRKDFVEDYMHRDYDNLSEDDKQNMTIDEVLAYYLYRVSQKVKQEFYVHMLRSFIMPF